MKRGFLPTPYRFSDFSPFPGLCPACGTEFAGIKVPVRLQPAPNVACVCALPAPWDPLERRRLADIPSPHLLPTAGIFPHFLRLQGAAPAFELCGFELLLSSGSPHLCTTSTSPAERKKASQPSSGGGPSQHACAMSGGGPRQPAGLSPMPAVSPDFGVSLDTSSESPTGEI